MKKISEYYPIISKLCDVFGGSIVQLVVCYKGQSTDPPVARVCSMTSPVTLFSVGNRSSNFLSPDQS